MRLGSLSTLMGKSFTIQYIKYIMERRANTSAKESQTPLYSPRHSLERSQAATNTFTLHFKVFEPKQNPYERVSDHHVDLQVPLGDVLDLSSLIGRQQNIWRDLRLRRIQLRLHCRSLNVRYIVHILLTDPYRRSRTPNRCQLTNSTPPPQMGPKSNKAMQDSLRL